MLTAVIPKLLEGGQTAGDLRNHRSGERVLGSTCSRDDRRENAQKRRGFVGVGRGGASDKS